jgi:hypothetical protein
MSTTATYRLDILRHVDRTHGGDYWVWSLITADGDRRDGGRVADLAGGIVPDGTDDEMDAERVACSVCSQCRIDREDVSLRLQGD